MNASFTPARLVVPMLLLLALCLTTQQAQSEDLPDLPVIEPATNFAAFAEAVRK